MRVVSRKSTAADLRRSLVVLALLQDIYVAMEELPVMADGGETLVEREKAIKSIFAAEEPTIDAVFAIGWNTARALKSRWGSSSEDAFQQGVTYAAIDYLTRRLGRDRVKKLRETYEENTQLLDYDVRAIERQVRLKLADMTTEMLESGEEGGILDELKPLTRFLILAAHEVDEWKAWAKREWNEWGHEYWRALGGAEPKNLNVSSLKSASTDREREWLLSFYASFVSRAIDSDEYSDELHEYLTSLVQEAGDKPLTQTIFLAEYILAILDKHVDTPWQFHEMLLTTRGIPRSNELLCTHATANEVELNLKIIDRWSDLDKKRRETLISSGDLKPIAAYNDAWRKFLIAMQRGDHPNPRELFIAALQELENRHKELKQLREAGAGHRYIISAQYLLLATESLVEHALHKFPLSEWFVLLAYYWEPYRYRTLYSAVFNEAANDLHQALSAFSKPAWFVVGN